jgi:hypothetical protein
MMSAVKGAGMPSASAADSDEKVRFAGAGGCSGARSCSAAPRAHCSRDDTDGSVVPASDIAGNSSAL